MPFQLQWVQLSVDTVSGGRDIRFAKLINGGLNNMPVGIRDAGRLAAHLDEVHKSGYLPFLTKHAELKTWLHNYAKTRIKYARLTVDWSVSKGASESIELIFKNARVYEGSSGIQTQYFEVMGAATLLRGNYLEHKEWE